MTLKSLALLMLTHVIFDFLLQDRETATKKSSQFSFLAGHLVIIAGGLLLFGLISEYTKTQALIFALSNAFLHGLIDWNIWKLYKFTVIYRFPSLKPGDQFEFQNDSMFYNFIAFDQLLHGLCYLGTHFLITGRNL